MRKSSASPISSATICARRLVNIRGFTSELEELRGDIFKRIATARPQFVRAAGSGQCDRRRRTCARRHRQAASQDFTEALGFIKSSIAKMDRADIGNPQPHPRGRREFLSRRK